LPAADELRRLPVQKPPGLLTADPGLATTPPPELGSDPAQAQLPLEAVPPAAATESTDVSDKPEPSTPSPT
jgi:hypothetical protein